MKAGDTRVVLGCAAPAHYRKFEVAERLRDPRTQHAQAHHTDRKVGALTRHAKGPLASAHVQGAGIKLAKVADDGLADVFGHLHRLSLIHI